MDFSFAKMAFSFAKVTLQPPPLNLQAISESKTIAAKKKEVRDDLTFGCWISFPKSAPCQA